MPEPAQLRTVTGGATMFCMVREMTASGARLRVPSTFALEGEVLITSSGIGPESRARITARDATCIDVAFS